jgi:hypothetical protein
MRRCGVRAGIAARLLGAVEPRGESRDGGAAAGAIDLVAGAGEVVADLLRDELLGFDRWPLRWCGRTRARSPRR